MAGERRPPGLYLVRGREGQRLLHPGLRHQARGAVASRKGSERDVERSDPGFEDLQHRNEAQDEARVDDVLARGSAMQAFRIGVAHSGTDLADEFRNDDAIAGDPGREGSPVGLEAATGSNDPVRVLGRNEPDGSFSLG